MSRLRSTCPSIKVLLRCQIPQLIGVVADGYALTQRLALITMVCSVYVSIAVSYFVTSEVSLVVATRSKLLPPDMSSLSGFGPDIGLDLPPDLSTQQPEGLEWDQWEEESSISMCAVGIVCRAMTAGEGDHSQIAFNVALTRHSTPYQAISIYPHSERATNRPLYVRYTP